MAGRAVTIYDVARRAGVGISTVSNALNKPDRVRPDTRKKVLDAAAELGFVPKSEAVSRARRGVGRVGVIGPMVAYGSYMRRLSGVLEVMNRSNLEVCLYDEESAAAKSSLLLSRLPLNSRLDGLIVMGIPLDDEAAQRLLDGKLPTVLVDTEDSRFSSVTTDYEATGQMIAQHLLQLGHTRFGYVSERGNPPLNRLQGPRRLENFCATLADGGCPASAVTAAAVSHNVDAARTAAWTMLRAHPDITAVVAHDDLLAVGVLQAAAELGLAVPESLAVVGCDDGDLALAAGLTTVQQPFEQSGRLAAGMLLGAMQAPQPRQLTYLAQELIVRRTSVPLASAGAE
jgi:LacI family transcriptional regulator